ncbi:MAG: glycoside hydrolase family 1 protein [Flexilinea sp.]
MPSATFTFPKKFLWGTATSAYQVEGQNKNNWTVWESVPGKILNGDISGPACDWWNGRWREDFDRAAETGQNTHRMSIEWSRIQPEPDRWDENALDYYREMIRGLISSGLRPMVTLHHFTDPLWFTKIGGWENEESPLLFQKYVEKVIPALKPLVKDWITINEPNVYILCGYLNGVFPPGKKMDIPSAFTALSNMVRAHATAYEIIHRVQTESRVGIAINYRGFTPKTKSIGDRILTNFLNANFNNSFMNAVSKGKLHFGFRSKSLPKAKGTQDFVGLNYYTGNQVHLGAYTNRFLSFPEDAMLSDTGFIANEPETFYKAIAWASSFGKPVIVTENGIENADDSLRPEYLADHLYQLWRAWTANLPVIGYYHWSLVDNFEWERGWTQRFGLWGLDLQTQKRIRRPSVDFYEQICKKNYLDSEDVAKFAPKSFSGLFEN